MVRAGHVLFDFLPVGEMLNVAEAIVRVFHRLGDYKHKQRNRLKFLVKSLGWDGFKAEFERELEAFRATGGASLPFDPEQPPAEAPPIPTGRTAPSVSEILARADSSRVIGPGIVPQVEPRANASPHEFKAWSRTNVRAQKQAGWSMVVVATVLGDLTSSQMRLIGELASAYGDGSVRITSDQNLVFRWIHSRDVEALYRSLNAAGLSRGGAGYGGGRHELPWSGVVQARGDPVARPRPSARGSASLAPRSRSGGAGPRHQRSAGARTVAVNTTSRGSASREAFARLADARRRTTS